MGSLMFCGGGLFFIILGLFLIKKHRSFVSNCIKLEGRVTDIVDEVYTRRGSFGQVTDRRKIKTPIVQYKYNRLYQFKAGIDARSHNLTHDSKVEVLINPLQPKTAKLSMGAQDNAMVFYSMVVSGLFILVLGIIQFNPNEFNIDFLYDPLLLAIVTVSIIFLYFKLWPVLSILPNAPIYSENAEEVKNEDSV